MSIGSRIKQARLQNGLSRFKLAELLDITPSSISNYENGISIPRIEILCAIINKLGVDANYLYQDLAPGYSPDLLTSVIHDYEYKYRALDERGRETVNGLLELEYSRAKAASAEKIKPPEGA